MATSGTIEHSGIISEISDKKIKVRIMPESACGNCHVKASCSIGDNDEKIIEVYGSSNHEYHAGEEIKVVLEQSLGLKAIAISYITPFSIMLAVLIILISMGLDEGTSGLLSLLSIFPWYIGLYFFRNRLKKEFSFRLKKL